MIVRIFNTMSRSLLCVEVETAATSQSLRFELRELLRVEMKECCSRSGSGVWYYRDVESR